MTGIKELAIKVAEKLGETISGIDFGDIVVNGVHMSQRKYLHNKAAEILFSEGMAVKIGQKVNDHFSSQARNSAGANIYEYYDNECDWWRTVTPEKVLNIWLEMNDD